MTLTQRGYHPRLIDKELTSMLETFGAVCIEGPRWCGKTWSSLNQSNSVIYVDDPSNDSRVLKLVSMDVNYALDGDAPHLIDEWQRFPPIWDAVRRSVDDRGRRGQYILTGSSVPDFTGVSHSGAGRIGRMRMRTMTLYESGDSDGSVSLKGLFDDAPMKIIPSDATLDRLIYLTIRGGWPAAIGLSAENAQRIARGYIEDTARFDVSRIGGIRRDYQKMMQFIRSLARNESTIASYPTLAKDVSDNEKETISLMTVTDYSNTLEALYLTNDQPAFDPNFRSSVRVGKSVKRHMVDPSLAVAALDMTVESVLSDLRTFGFLFEALCERDLQVYAQAIGGKLYHYRDGKGREIDAVVELSDGRWGAFEIKLGTDQIDKAAASLLKIRKMADEDPTARIPSLLCVICGLAPCAYKRDDGVYVVPITSLRE
jgi:uncharacterized protein